LDNGTALSSLAGRRGQVAIAPQPHHRRGAKRVRRGALMVAQVRLCRAGQRVSSETRPSDRPPKRRSCDSRPGCLRPARGLPHRSRCGGVVAPSRQFRRSMPAALGAESIQPPQQTAEIADGRRHNCSRETMAFAARTPTAPRCGPACPTFLPFTGEALNGNVDNTPAPGTPVSLCVPRRCSRASSGATAGWTTGPPYQASPAAEAKLHPRHSGITAGELDEFVEGP